LFTRLLMFHSLLVLGGISGLYAGVRSSPQPAAPCHSAPTPPTNVLAKVDRGTLTLSWKASTGAPDQYSVEVGNAPGSTYLGTADTGNPGTSFTKTLAPGIYYVRLRAANACGVSAVSHELRVAVDQAHIGARTQPDVVVARRTATRNTYFPTAERLKNGQIVVVYYDSPDHVSPAGRIAMVRSADQGRTWSAPTVVVDGPRDERDPNIIETSRGTLLVSYFESDATQSPTSRGVFVTRSDDAGRTWSPPVAVATTLEGAATSGKIVQVDGGDLLVPMYGARAGGTDAVAAIVRSSDDGRTWSKESETTIAALPGVSFVEPALAYLGDGRLLAMIRTEGAERYAHESYSLDGGRTWSPPARTALVAQASDLLPIREGPQKGLLVHAWGDVSGRFGDSRPTVMQVVRFNEFPNARWTSEPRLLHQGHCWSDEGYPSSVQLPDGRVFTVYYDACAGYIGGTFSSLSDPGAQADCSDPPPPPVDLKVTSNSGAAVTLAWTAAPGKLTSYVLEAGKTSGAADVITIDLGLQTVYTAAQVSPGTYYARVRSRNACGAGAASNEVVMVVR
jgi:BNR repeat protein/fibronectin type III domain protein